jgi:hypothetical protein
MFSGKFHGRRVRSEVRLLRGLKLVSFNRSHILGFSLGH